MLLNDLSSLFGGHLNISDLILARLEDLNYRLILANADAARLRNGDLLAETGLADLLDEGVENGSCSGGDAAVAMPTTTLISPVPSRRMTLSFIFSLIAASSANDFIISILS